MNQSSDKPHLRWVTDSTLSPALASSLLCWLAFPPVGWSLLAWVAPIGWLYSVARHKLPGSRPYRNLWVAGLAFWLLTIHWIRLPHPVNYLGWLALASYLGCYLPVFVALSRIGVHRLRLPLWLVAPVVWTGLDWVRGHLMTGFLMGSLAHTQVDHLSIIQIANVLGEYGVTFLILLVASCLLNIFFDLQKRERSGVYQHLAILILAWLATQNYGTRFSKSQPADMRIAVIQGNTLADWKNDAQKQQQIMDEHMSLSLAAVKASRKHDGRDVDLVIWPETSFRQALLTVADGYQPPGTYVHESVITAAQKDLQEFVRQTGAAILTGIDRLHYYPDATGQPDYRVYNSSILMDKQGQIAGTYEKMHLVLMGEYVPFTEWLPFLKRLTPITGLATPGQQPQGLEAEGYIFCPNICYETVVPHLIRRHVTELAAAGKTPDVLVNLTNDSWFWGSSELDMHLACGIFRAVEMRTPLVIAANGGLSAHVDAHGQVLQVTPKQQTATLLIDLPKRGTTELTLYAQWGDWFAGGCMVCCVVLAAIGWHSHRAKLSPQGAN